MARELASTVVLSDDASGETQVYPAGTKEGDLPSGVAKRITNPAAWSESEPARRGSDKG